MNKILLRAPKVSVIVPVYNTGNYLAKCLDSITGQTLGDIEILVLNDGSPDDSAEIARAYAAKDSRIKYLEHKNIGLGMTRNRGMAEAKGEYLAFVDSDDFIEPEMMELMYKKAKTEDLDVAVCQTFMNYNDSQVIRKKLQAENPIDLKGVDKSEFFRKYLFTNKYRYCAWDKLYRRSFIVDNGIVFGDNRKFYAEDLYFQMQVILNNPVINFLPQTFYHYVQREDSITASIRRDYMKRHLAMVNHFYNISKDRGQDISMAADVILFRGLLNEANYNAVHKLGFSSFRKSCREFYKNPAYSKFIRSSAENKSSGLIPNPRRRALFKLFVFLGKLRLKWISEFIIYYKSMVKAGRRKSDEQ